MHCIFRQFLVCNLCLCCQKWMIESKCLCLNHRLSIVHLHDLLLWQLLLRRWSLKGRCLLGCRLLKRFWILFWILLLFYHGHILLMRDSRSSFQLYLWLFNSLIYLSKVLLLLVVIFLLLCLLILLSVIHRLDSLILFTLLFIYHIFSHFLVLLHLWWGCICSLISLRWLGWLVGLRGRTHYGKFHLLLRLLAILKLRVYLCKNFCFVLFDDLFDCLTFK